MSVRGTAAPLTDSVALTFQSLSHFLKYGRKPEHQQEENALHSGVRTHSVSSIFPHLTALICPTQLTYEHTHTLSVYLFPCLLVCCSSVLEVAICDQPKEERLH